MWALVLALLALQTPDYTAEGMKALDDGRYDAAAQSFVKAIAADPKDYFAHFNLALAYSMSGKDADASAEYRKTLELRPKLYEAELNLAILLLRQNNPADALPLLADAVEQKPSELRPRQYLADAQLQSGSADAAEESYRRALELDPKSAPAELGLAHALARQEKLADSAPHFRKAAELDPKNRRYLLELAGLYDKAGQTDEALALYREFPDNAAAQRRAGELLLKSKQFNQAIPELEKAYQASPTPASRLALARAYVSARQLDKATPLLDQSVAAAPSDYDLRMLYATVLRDRKQYQPAASQFYAAAKLKPDDAQTWGELGSMFYLMGSYPQALSAFDRARELGQDTPGNWFFRAIILDKLKQLKPALEAYRKFLSMSQGKNPDQEFQARQRARIIQRDLERR